MGNQTTERGFLGETPPKAIKNISAWDKRKKIWELIIEENKCSHHSLPDKPVVCWRGTDGSGEEGCFPVTEGNIWYWANLVVRCFAFRLQLLLLTFNYQEKEPMKFNVAQKPAEINCMAHGMRDTTCSSQMAKASANHGMY